jgi:hypothetical protein
MSPHSRHQASPGGEDEVASAVDHHLHVLPAARARIDSAQVSTDVHQTTGRIQISFVPVSPQLPALTIRPRASRRLFVVQ